MLLMFLSGFGKIYSDFSDQLSWAPSARINDLFHQRVRSCDRQPRLRNERPNPSLSPCTTPGKADKNSGKFFSFTARAAQVFPCHLPGAE